MWEIVPSFEEVHQSTEIDFSQEEDFNQEIEESHRKGHRVICLKIWRNREEGG